MNNPISVHVDIAARINAAESRYGGFASTHEGLGVALEEWQELCDAVRANDMDGVASECIDLAAVLIRLAVGCRENEALRQRSVK